MPKAALIGRKAECNRLTRCLNETQAQLVIVYGRRRVGKTFLVNHFFEGQFDFKCTGAYGQKRDLQLRNFSAELRRQSGISRPAPKDWTEAFDQLRNYLSNLPKDQKHIVFFDELPWMDTPRSGFLAAFEWFWNDWGSAQEDLLLIVCGSATSWMVQHIAENKGGLFNRVTCRLYLNPFTLHETELYLQSRGIDWSRYDIAECYMTMGGIPYYLSMLDPELSCAANIDRMFFKKRGELWDEFDHLYRTLFAGSDQYVRVVEALSKKRSGLTRKEIAQVSGLPSNGVLTKILAGLMDSGFVNARSFYGHKSREKVYLLADYYSFFYFRFIREHYGADEHFWQNAVDLPSRRAWAGLTFEQLCADHIPQIKQKLGLAGVVSQEYTWFSDADGAKDSGAQIDLLIDRRDHVINLCEMKFSVNEFEIDKSYDQNLRNKIAVFRQSTDCKKTIQLTLITTFGVKKNKYSGIMTNQLTLDDLFLG